eukprot:1135826-Rhodomonas_salina.1
MSANETLSTCFLLPAVPASLCNSSPTMDFVPISQHLRNFRERIFAQPGNCYNFAGVNFRLCDFLGLLPPVTDPSTVWALTNPDSVAQPLHKEPGPDRNSELMRTVAFCCLATHPASALPNYLHFRERHGLWAKSSLFGLARIFRSCFHLRARSGIQRPPELTRSDAVARQPPTKFLGQGRANWLVTGVDAPLPPHALGVADSAPPSELCPSALGSCANDSSALDPPALGSSALGVPLRGSPTPGSAPDPPTLGVEGVNRTRRGSRGSANNPEGVACDHQGA